MRIGKDFAAGGITGAIDVKPRLERHATDVGCPFLIDDLLDHVLDGPGREGIGTSQEGFDIRFGDTIVECADTLESGCDSLLISSLRLGGVVQTGIRNRASSTVPM